MGKEHYRPFSLSMEIVTQNAIDTVVSELESSDINCSVTIVDRKGDPKLY